jgi:hypothetical protein
MIMTFEDDLRLIESYAPDVPTRQMIMRHWRSSLTAGVDAPSRWRGVGQPHELYSALYPIGTKRGSRALISLQLRSTYDMVNVSQESTIVVKGWTDPGRGAVIITNEVALWPILPCTRPLRGPRLIG